MPGEPRITLLGPQRNPRLPKVRRDLGLRTTRFATITAGWRDREGDDELLSELLGGDTINLQLWTRMQQVWEADPELEKADRRRRRVLTEMQELYVIGLQQAVEGVHRITARTPRLPELQQLALDDTLEILRDMDERHRRRVSEVHLEFYERYQPQHRDHVAAARIRVGQLIAECGAVAIPGGHVGVLLGALHLFNLAPALGYPHKVEQEDGTVVTTPRLYRPVLAWGAGAMALTERVFLYHDFAVVHPGISEVLMDGIGLTRGLVALPSAKDRINLKDVPSSRSFARRMAPRVALLLDEGARVTLTQDGELPASGMRILTQDGHARKVVAEPAHGEPGSTELAPGATGPTPGTTEDAPGTTPDGEVTP